MESQTKAIIDASIQLEHNIADLYCIFYAAFDQHAEFWWKLHLEERNHASLIKMVRDYFGPVGIHPENLLYTNLQDLHDCNNFIRTTISRFENCIPDEAEAFNIALAIEKTAGEAHYQDFMSSNEQLSSLFRRLNSDDKDHYERILSYMRHHNVPITEIDMPLS